MKGIRLLLEHQLPHNLRDYGRNYDAKGFNQLLARAAREHPEEYSSIIGKIADVGRNASYDQGESLTLEDLKPVIDKDSLFKGMEAQIAQAKKFSNTDAEFRTKRMKIWQDTNEHVTRETQREGLRRGNNIAYSVLSGARGKAPQLNSMISAPGIFQDGNGVPIEMYAKHSHSEGLRPAEFLASTYGARSAVISTKVATAKGGDISKQLTSLLSTLNTTRKSTGSDNGVDLDIEDPSLKYRVLARPTGGFSAGTLITTPVLAELRRKKVPFVIAHSPITDESPESISAESAGGMDGGHLYQVGRTAGITAAHAIGEPITQAALNVKHTAGVAGKKREFSGMKYLNSFVQSPEAFPDKAPVSELEGTVHSIKDAPQGGKFVYVGDQEHYIPEGLGLLVKPGDKLEAGDALSDGIADPRDIVRLRGLGEGRRYYATRLKQLLDDSGIQTDLKHTEMVARGALDHVRITDAEGLGDYLPDDTVSYNKLAASYVPPADTERVHPGKGVGRYLQAPALHYTIGTKLTPRMVEHLASRGYDKVAVANDAPGFEPDMDRLRTASHVSDDFLARQNSSYQAKSWAESAMRGEDSNIRENISPYPRLARGVGFGDAASKTGKF